MKKKLSFFVLVLFCATNTFTQETQKSPCAIYEQLQSRLGGGGETFCDRVLCPVSELFGGSDSCVTQILKEKDGFIYLSFTLDGNEIHKYSINKNCWKFHEKNLRNKEGTLMGAGMEGEKSSLIFSWAIQLLDHAKNESNSTPNISDDSIRQTTTSDSVNIYLQVVELFRVSQLAWGIVEHIPVDALIIDTADTDIFYTSIVREKELIFLEIKSTAGLWRRELRVGKIFIFWYPENFTGGLIIQQRMRWDFYDLWGVRSKKPDLKPRIKDKADISHVLGAIEEYILSKKK